MTPTIENTGKALGMLAITGAWNTTNKCKVCNQTGLTKERYECPCRKGIPFSAKDINRILYGY